MSNKGQSTPLKDDVNPNFSTISAINIPLDHMEPSILQETVNHAGASPMPFVNATPRKRKCMYNF